MCKLQGSTIKSCGTVRSYESALTQIAKYLDKHKLGSLINIDIETATKYLQDITMTHSKKTINIHKSALQIMMRNVTLKLDENKFLPKIEPVKSTTLLGRTYSLEQVTLISLHQQPHNSLATRIAYSAGLRAHEILTISHPDEQPADPRPCSKHKFRGRNGVIYTVVGKGGLVREVLIPNYLSRELEKQRLSSPRKIRDRIIYYQAHYKIGGGQPFSNSFSQTSKRLFGWSRGAHGMRHSYAQSRILELQLLGLSQYEAKISISQELGHFRPDIIDVYLR